MSKLMYDNEKEKELGKLEKLVEVHENLYNAIEEFLKATEDSHPLSEKMIFIQDIVEEDGEEIEKKRQIVEASSYEEEKENHDWDEWKDKDRV